MSFKQMLVIDFKAMTTQVTLRLFVLYALLLIGINAQAAGTCLADKSDISEDMRKINAKLDIKYSHSAFQNNAERDAVLNQIYDEQELKVDRSDKFLKQVDAVGVITDSPIGSQKGYGSAVLISPCHILVNAHAIIGERSRKGLAPVYVSLGQNTCESKNEFLHQDIVGKVIAIGDSSVPAAAGKDYAIVRINKISDIKPAIVSTDDIRSEDSLMSVGFPLRSTYSQKTGLRYPTANFAKMTGTGTDGTFKTSNSLPRPGGSGSGIFILDNDNGRPQVMLGGIHQSEGGVGLQTSTIIEHLKISNPKVLSELSAAIESGACN